MGIRTFEQNIKHRTSAAWKLGNQNNRGENIFTSKLFFFKKNINTYQHFVFNFVSLHFQLYFLLQCNLYLSANNILYAFWNKGIILLYSFINKRKALGRTASEGAFLVVFLLLSFVCLLLLLVLTSLIVIG